MAEPSNVDLGRPHQLEPVEGRAKRAGLLEGKPQISLVFEFRRALEGAARALAEGVDKYGRGNWRKGMPQEEVLDSLGRHIVALASGEQIDPASGLPHADKILTNAMLLSEYWHQREQDYLDAIGAQAVPEGGCFVESTSVIQPDTQTPPNKPSYGELLGSLEQSSFPGTIGQLVRGLFLWGRHSDK